MDQDLPIAYTVLEGGVPVTGSDGQRVGTVHHVVAAPEEDIFHGIVIATGGSGRRFVEAADVASIHEHGVDLRIDSAAARDLPEPNGGAPTYSGDPGSVNTWSHWVNRLTGRTEWKRRS
jgi:hypothetical protein